ncbi:hypothetical protein EYF80_018779 [Liparis tanakae]|uniref:Uncharacterized protein n=1 Tax=Liparis tanakae TaxID=230148 RepID=A0A4Z2I165_9TELE|nr:hypothetical protein EYF80_018779 [Liparis tanakae]
MELDGSSSPLELALIIHQVLYHEGRVGKGDRIITNKGSEIITELKTPSHTDCCGQIYSKADRAADPGNTGEILWGKVCLPSGRRNSTRCEQQGVEVLLQNAFCHVLQMKQQQQQKQQHERNKGNRKLGGRLRYSFRPCFPAFHMVKLSHWLRTRSCKKSTRSFQMVSLETEDQRMDTRRSWQRDPLPLVVPGWRGGGREPPWGGSGVMLRPPPNATVTFPWKLRTAGHISEESEEKLSGAKEGGAYTKLNNMPEDRISIQNRRRQSVTHHVHRSPLLLRTSGRCFCFIFLGAEPLRWAHVSLRFVTHLGNNSALADT